MRPIADNTVIQIEITNDCWLSCANCTRHVGHHRDPFYMTVEEARHAIECTLDAGTHIGMMGGEPTLHPQFGEMLDLWQELVPPERRELWTAGYRWKGWEPHIRATFAKERIHYNDHTQTTGCHQPLLVAIDEVVEDAGKRREMIENCPFQLHWSASITPHGAYFCEIGASLDVLLNDGKNAWPVEPGWWQRVPRQYADQIEPLCNKCSGALPMAKHSDARGGRDPATNVDLISAGNLDRLEKAGSPKIEDGRYQIYEGGLPDVKDWKPREYRDFEAHTPEEVRAHRGKA